MYKSKKLKINEINFVLKQFFLKKNLPCCINVPIENQSVLLTVKRFSKTSYSVSHGYGFLHSSGEHRAISNNIKLTVNTAANV